jgi:glycosyltransferase involved in cell wall biosynthesis
MRPKLSVIICTHNPKRQYLERALNSLRDQSLSHDDWELIVIDNASVPALEGAWDLSWHPHARIVCEPQLGLTPARLRGIAESRADLLLYVDDDNVLHAAYLATANQLMEENPHLSVIGAGRLEPEFEVQPTPELAPVLSMLALRSVPSLLWSNNPKDSMCIPWGAGLCVRRETASFYERLVEQLRCSSVLDRKGQQLFSGGDDLFSWAAARTGKGFGIFPELHVTHLITSGRVTQSYFLRLIRDHSFSHGVLRYVLANMQPQRNGVIEFIRILLHGLRRGRFSMQCRFASVQGSAAAFQFITNHHLSPIE